MKKAFLLALTFVGLPFALRAQVSINTTGDAPAASAMLDVSSTSKGLLPPRMTQAQRTQIASPATGLVVYQTDGTAGLYCNNGTPTIPLWQQVAARVQPAYGHFASLTSQALTTPYNTYFNCNFTNAYESSGLSFDAGADAVTIITPGVYRIFYTLELFFNGFGNTTTQLHKNGTAIGRIIYRYSSAQGQMIIPVSDDGMYTLNAGDVITLKTALQNGNSGSIQGYGATLTLQQIY
jgi:hypothetical protein